MIISLEQAKPGMIIASDILLPNGAVLVHASQLLSPAIIENLRRRDIHEVPILEKSDVPPPQSPNRPLTSHTIPQAPTAHTVPLSVEPEPEPEPVATPPKIECIIDKDAMSAICIIAPTEAAHQELTPDFLLEFLNNQGVIFGIDELQVHSAAIKFNKEKKRFEVKNIARGVPPEAGREGNLEVIVSHLSTKEDVDKAKSCAYFWQIDNLKSGMDRINPGTCIAERKTGTLPVPGKNIKGDIIPTDEIIRVKIDLDSSVAFSKNEGRIESKIAGICFFADNRIGVLPVNFDGSLEIAITPDSMQAHITIHPAGEGGQPPQLAAIQKLMADSQIVYGIKQTAISELAANLARQEYPTEQTLIAEGTAPFDGENGAIDFLVPTTTSLAPKANSDGSVDYKNVAIVHSVAQGNELARLIPPKKGVPGKNILGKELPAKDGTEEKLPTGANTLINPDNKSVLIAGTDGIVHYNGHAIDIFEGYVIKGDVDFSTGNIKYAKSVVVNGDIKSGFKVDCGGDLQVSGTIEDAEIIVSGNVLCKLGFVGTGKGIIDAKGDVNIGFMKNQTIKSRQNVTIAKEAINSTIFARKTISVHGNPMSVVGGVLIARDSIQAHTIGNNSGVKTICEIGLDFTLIDELKLTEDHIKEILNNRTKIIDTQKKYDQLLKIKKRLAPKEELLYEKLKQALVTYDQQIKVFQDRSVIIKQKMYNFQNAFIKIDHAAKPGTIFKLGERHFLVKDEVIGPKVVRLLSHEVRIL